MVGGRPGESHETVTPTGFDVGSALPPRGTMVPVVAAAAAATVVLVAVAVAGALFVLEAAVVGAVDPGRVKDGGAGPPAATSAFTLGSPGLSMEDREEPNAFGEPTTTSTEVSPGVRARLP